MLGLRRSPPRFAAWVAASRPISAERFAQHFDPLLQRALQLHSDRGLSAQVHSSGGNGAIPAPLNLVVAVSGGPDSLALAGLLQEWAARHQEGTQPHNSDDNSINASSTGYNTNNLSSPNSPRPWLLHSVTVDHRQRPESHDEALRVQRRLAEWVVARNTGVDASFASTKVLRLPEITATGLSQEELRDARLGLLAEFCDRVQARVLVLGQHAQDQAELFLMRLFRGSRVAGLAGMPHLAVQRMENWETAGLHANSNGAGYQDGLGPGPGPRLPPIVRPLLPFRKAELLATCRRLGLDWEVDPSNALLKYDRNRARFFLHLAERGRDPGLLRSALRVLPSGIGQNRLLLESEYASETPGKETEASDHQDHTIVTPTENDSTGEANPIDDWAPLTPTEIAACADRFRGYAEDLRLRTEAEVQRLSVWVSLGQGAYLVDLGGLRALPTALAAAVLVQIMEQVCQPAPTHARPQPWISQGMGTPRVEPPRFAHRRIMELVGAHRPWPSQRIQFGPVCVVPQATEQGAAGSAAGRFVWVVLEPSAAPERSTARMVREAALEAHRDELQRRGRDRRSSNTRQKAGGRMDLSWPDLGLPAQLDRRGLRLRPPPESPGEPWLSSFPALPLPPPPPRRDSP